jgi:hypothetical protein
MRRRDGGRVGAYGDVGVSPSMSMSAIYQDAIMGAGHTHTNDLASPYHHHQ